MQTVLIISVFTLTTAATVPSNWQLSSLDRTGDLFIEETRPVVQGEIFPRAAAPGYSTNAINSKQNQPTHLPVNNIQWVPIIPTTNPYTFLTPPVKVANKNANSQNNPDFVSALNNFFNVQSNVADVNGVTNGVKANIQRGLSQQIQHEQRNLNNNPVFQHNQVQFIPYSTRDINTNTQRTGNSQSLNVKQTHPQVNSQNTAAPYIDLDFNLNNPFAPIHQANKVQQKYIRHKSNFNTNQPGLNFDLNFDVHFPHNRPVISTANQHNTQIPQIQLPPVNSKNIQVPNRLRATQSLTNLDFDPNNPFYKKNRDDPQYDREPIPKAERLKSEKAPISTHEYPAEVPTRPIYPGEGQWAKFGVKHTPFIGHHKFTPLEESKTVPEGYDTFLEAQKLFDFQNNQFGKKLQEFPQKHQLGTSLPSDHEIPHYEPLKSKVTRNQYDHNEEEEEEEENRKDTFKPTRLYAQVRQSDEEKHLPSAADENGRLKELVKDTKVHTIYSEEGYEDSAYDHAGHEKKAENAEDYEKDKKHVEKKEEKSKPVRKFHLPKVEDIDTQEDIQNLKRELSNLDDDDDDDDSETSSTQQSKAYVSKEKPPKKVYSAKTKDASKYKTKKHDFMESTGSDPVATIVKGAGNTEIEISSEVKLIVQPNNVTKAHKFVKIYPKFHSEDKLNKNLDEKRVKTTSTEIPFTTITPTKFEDIFPVEIPATTQATTAIPKIRTPLPNISRRRRKRFANYFPKIEVDTDFIDKINHTLPEKKDLTKEKYPYYFDYKKIGLHEDSPLRYAEDLRKVPVKTDGTLAFYKQADKRKKCSEVDEVVDPVPDRIKKADKKPEEVDGSTDVAELAESPRLTQLGDKIDCFKARYFGENPFDNPLFKEKVVGPVKPIFEEFDSSPKQKITKAHTKKDVVSENLRRKNSKRDLTNKRDVENEENDIESDALEKNYKKFVKNDLYTYSVPLKSGSWEASNDNSLKDTDPHEDEEVIDVESNSEDAATEINSNDITEESQVQTLPPATLITTPKYTISLKPKHIYDQIELLQYLPIDEYSDITTEKVIEKIVTHEPEDKLFSNEKGITSTEENNFDKTTKSNTEEAVTNKVDNDRITETVTETIDKTGRSHIENKDKTHINENKFISKSAEKTVPNKHEHGAELADKKSQTIKDKIENKDEPYLEKLSEGGTQKTFTREPQESISERRMARVLNYPKGIASEENSGEFLPEAESLAGRIRTKGIIKKPLYEIFDINDYLPKIPLPQPPFTDIILTQPIRPKVNIPQEQTFDIFDVNKYLPTPFPIATQSTVLPKSKVVSEVFYKDDIKPNEQLNVFTDVFNNIKNSPVQQQDVIHDASEQISVKLKVDEVNNDKNLKNVYMTSIASTTTGKPTRYRNRNKNNRLHNSPNPAKKRITGRRPYYETDNRTKRGQTTTTIKPNILDILHKNHQMHNNEKPVKKVADLNVYNHTDEEKIESTTKTASEPIQLEQEKSTKIMGLVPPDPHIYKTIYHPKRDNTQDLSNDGLVEERKLNKYIVPGMKPPPRQRVYDYSDYLTLNHIQYAPGKSKRSKRSATRPAYAEVSRNKVKQEETNTEKDTNKDDDDYVPHRTRNYHYDEKTGKIVYDKKPEENEESEEVEYIEVVEETPPSTTSKPKQNPIFATATPPPEGKGYIDFVKLLKSATNYHEIPDPTTTEKGKESTTETIPTTTIKPVSTSPPEFLSILAKVRNDSNYKFIEEKKKTKTTTIKPTEEEEDVEEEEESQVENIKNSPGSPGVVDGDNFKLFDITDFLPNVKNYMPKTAIDTSKYKSIERPTTRRNNAQKGEVKETSQDKVVSPTTRTSRRGNPITTTETPATSKPTRSLTRRRTTTSSSVTTTQEGVTETPKPGSGSEAAHHDKARRTYRRRNPRIKSTPTATSTEKYLTDDVENTTKIILRRSQRDSSVLLLNTDNNNKVTSEDYVDQSKPLNRVDEQGRYEKELDKNVDDKNADPTPVVQQVVEIFKNYDKTKRHGGNYRDEDEVASENRLGQSQQNKILPYEGKKEDVEVFKKYDKTKKHGGNYKAENEGEAQFAKQTANIEEENDKSNIEVFRNYDKTKKHGGNYKSEDEIQHISEPLYEESRVVTPTRNQIDTNGKKNKDVEVLKDYDKNKKHGGNYMHENDFLRKQNVQNNSKPVEVDKAKDVEIFNNYDKTKKHGGNYRPESEAILDPHYEETSYGNPKLPQKRDQENTKDQPLPLTILKPEFFYTDPKLPVVINGLKIVDGMSPEELEEIVASAEAESASDDFDDGRDKDEKEDRKDKINVAGVVPQTSPPVVSTTTTKPLFIKDPGKRLYYYAPLR